MNIIPTENVQIADTDPCQVHAYCLSIPLILRRILTHFDNAALLKLSFVNKLWNYEARSLMRDRGNLEAWIPSHDQCQYLQAFAADLQNMNVVPFGGIYVRLGREWNRRHDECQPLPTADTDREIILRRLPWKLFSFQLSEHWLNFQCPSFLLTKEILQNFGGTLEELHISILIVRNKVIEEIIQQCSFPRLKTLKIFENNCQMDTSYTKFLKTLVSQAPGLEELHSYAPLSLLANVLEGRSTRLIYYRSGFNEVPESIIGQIRLKDVRLNCRSALHLSGEPFSIDQFNRITPQLLRISCETLTSMCIDAALLVPLKCHGICLNNVTQLTIVIDPRHLQLVQPSVSRLLMTFDFTRVFPSLTNVDVRFQQDLIDPQLSTHDISAFIEQANVVLNEPLLPDRAARIKYLDAFRGDLAIQFLAQMFPDIDKLSLSGHDEFDTDIQKMSFIHIWTHFVDLKEFEASYEYVQQCSRAIGHLDSIFCGIFPQEVAELREKDEEYLKRVNIVPVIPSFIRMRNLRTFKIIYTKSTDDGEPNFDHLASIFSKVTTFLAFRRCPQLESVTLEMRTRRLDTSQREPRVSLIYSRP